MTDYIYGAALGSGTAGWSDTMIDRSIQLGPAGTTITALGLYLADPKTVTLKIAREIDAATYEFVVSEAFEHPGGGWADLTLSTPFVVPVDGAYRLACFTGTAAPATPLSVAVDRASKDGDRIGTVGRFYPMHAPTVVMRALIGEGSPPPPPQGDPHKIFALLGQSNMKAFGDGSGGTTFVERYLELVSGCTAQTVNYAANSSYIFHWQPGQALFDSTAADLAARLQAPGVELGAVLWLQGEAETRGDRTDECLHWQESLRTIANRLWSALNLNPQPFVVTELFEQPDASFPLWRFQQDNQRLVTTPGWRTHIEGSVLVSIADLAGSGVPPLHLAAPALEELGRRYAEALA